MLNIQTAMPDFVNQEVGAHEPIQIELGDLVQHIRSSAIPNDLPPTTRFVGLENIAANEGEFLELSTTSEVRSRVFCFQAEDVLYGRLRPYQRKSAVASFDGFASGEVIILRCSERILPRYLRIVFLSENFTRYVNARVKGDRPRASFATIASYRIDLPSLETQQEICARDSRLHDAVRRLGEATATVGRTTDFVLSQMRSRLLWGSDPDETLVPLADMVESIDYGTSQKSTYGASGTPVLRIPNIASSGVIDAADLKYSPLTPHELERSQLELGDILLVRSNGSLALVGRAAKVGTEHVGYAFAGYLLRMRPKAGVSSDYLLQVVRSDAFQRLVAAASRSSTGINNLSAGRLGAFVVPRLDAEGQRRAVEILGRLQDSAASSSGHVRQAWTQAKILHEVARRGWLGHPSPSASDEIAPDGAQIAAPDQLKNEGQQVQRDIQTIVLEKLDGTVGGQASFETLFDGVSSDYDVARDVIFGLLGATPPILTQAFDQPSRSIVLRRPN